MFYYAMSGLWHRISLYWELLLFLVKVVFEFILVRTQYPELTETVVLSHIF